jgi:hypothetical protein
MYIKIDEWDTWNMETTLGYIIRPMMAQLKATKHGAPFVDIEVVPAELRPEDMTEEERMNGGVDSTHFKRWDWVIDEIIFAFDSLPGGKNEDWEDQFTSGTSELHFKRLEDGMSEMVHGENDTMKIDWDGRQKYADRINKGFLLFGKYYTAMWD